MNERADRTWLPEDLLAAMSEGVEVRLLAQPRVVFRKNANGTWDELPRSSGSFVISERGNVSSATICLLGVEDVI